ncbi:MAG: UDP-2,4-diacetamido-2,4,6-trideoxy-beta-L-altropyranose hydrolase [Planctomycetota bacterium]
MAGTLLVRADAGPQTGTGHLMRGLALARAWQSAGGRATFASCCGVEGLRERIRVAGAGLVSLERPHPDPADLKATLGLLAKTQTENAPAAATWLVLDGYQFDSAYQQAIREAGARLLVVDDMAHLGHYHAHVLLNQNLDAERLDYTCDDDTALLLGCRYALLRPEFQRWRSFRRETPEAARRLLVTLGGADPDNLTGTVITALGHLDPSRLEVKVMVGSANPHLETLRGQIGRTSPEIELLTDVTEVPELLAWADAALSAAGITCLELAFMQLPAVLLPLVEHQEPIARRLAAAGAATSLGRADRITAEAIARALSALCRDRSRRAGQSQAGSRLVDGRGADRAVAVMQALGDCPDFRAANMGLSPSQALGGCPDSRAAKMGLSPSGIRKLFLGPSEVKLRPAAVEDAMPLWRLRNDPAVRRASLGATDPVPLKSHLRWFKRRLASPGSCIWVLDFHGVILAQIRYDRTDAAAAEISISVATAFRQRGLAAKLIEMTRRPACERLGVRRLRAIARQENFPSVRTFAKAGFTKVDSRPVQNRPCHIFEFP